MEEFYVGSILGLSEIQLNNFIKEAENFDTLQYTEKIMEAIFIKINLLPFSLMKFKKNLSRDMFYHRYYEQIEKLLKLIVIKAQNKENKEVILHKLFEFLEPFSNKFTGDFFGVTDFISQKEEAIKNIMNEC